MDQKEHTDNKTTAGFEETQKPFGTKFAKRELVNLEKLQRIVSGIVDSIQGGEALTNAQIKFAAMPTEEAKSFAVNEINKLSDSFIHDFSCSLKELISHFTLEHKYYYRFCVIEKGYNKDMAKLYDEFDNNWMCDFVRDFACYYWIEKEIVPDIDIFPNIKKGKEFLPYLEFDYNLLGDIDDYYTEDLIDMIPLPDFPDLIDCLVKMSEHQLLFDLYYRKDETLNKLNSEVTGLNTKLNKHQIKTLHKKLNDNFLKTPIEHFEAFLTNKNLMGIRIKWIDLSTTRKTPNKSTIYEFLYLLKECNYIESKEFDTNPTNPNNLYRKLKSIFPDITNFPNSNPYGIQRKTARHKELETIIQSL
ncbi:hypothetical protein QA597_06680 [Marinilabiliaceae bacterium ANBcel2]|nr:hypothetical protein [Marinilabiliaceae bacterium ANBcel2]